MREYKIKPVSFLVRFVSGNKYIKNEKIVINYKTIMLYLISDATSSGEAVNLQSKLRSLSTELTTLRTRINQVNIQIYVNR